MQADKRCCAVGTQTKSTCGKGVRAARSTTGATGSTALTGFGGAIVLGRSYLHERSTHCMSVASLAGRTGNERNRKRRDSSRLPCRRDDILPCRVYLRHCVLAAKGLVRTQCRPAAVTSPDSPPSRPPSGMSGLTAASIPTVSGSVRELSGLHGSG